MRTNELPTFRSTSKLILLRAGNLFLLNERVLGLNFTSIAPNQAPTTLGIFSFWEWVADKTENEPYHCVLDSFIVNLKYQKRAKLL